MPYLDRAPGIGSFPPQQFGNQILKETEEDRSWSSFGTAAAAASAMQQLQTVYVLLEHDPFFFSEDPSAAHVIIQPNGVAFGISLCQPD
jgi:hypothetical protein